MVPSITELSESVFIFSEFLDVINVWHGALFIISIIFSAPRPALNN